MHEEDEGKGTIRTADGMAQFKEKGLRSGPLLGQKERQSAGQQSRPKREEKLPRCRGNIAKGGRKKGRGFAEKEGENREKNWTGTR